MAQQKVVKLIDDVDGSKAVETVTFAIDGSHYEIDLNAKNASKLRGGLEQFVQAGRKVRPDTVHRARRRPGAGKAGGGSMLAEVRAWAKQNGYEVAERGRIAASVAAAYDAAHPA